MIFSIKFYYIPEMQSTIILRRSRGLRANGMKTYVKEIIRCLYLNLKLSVPLLKYPLATWYVIMAQHIDMPVSGSPESYWYLLRAQINFPGQQIVYPVCRPVLDMLNDVTQPFFWLFFHEKFYRSLSNSIGYCWDPQNAFLAIRLRDPFFKHWWRKPCSRT